MRSGVGWGTSSDPESEGGSGSGRYRGSGSGAGRASGKRPWRCLIVPTPHPWPRLWVPPSPHPPPPHSTAAFSTLPPPSHAAPLLVPLSFVDPIALLGGDTDELESNKKIITNLKAVLGEILSGASATNSAKALNHGRIKDSPMREVHEAGISRREMSMSPILRIYRRKQ